MDITCHWYQASKYGVNFIGPAILRVIIWLVQIPLTIIYFVFSFLGSVISGMGWLFGTAVFGVTIILWVFGEFDTWYQIVTALAISATIVWAPGFIVDFVGEGIMLFENGIIGTYNMIAM